MEYTIRVLNNEHYKAIINRLDDLGYDTHTLSSFPVNSGYVNIEDIIINWSSHKLWEDVKQITLEDLYTDELKICIRNTGEDRKVLKVINTADGEDIDISEWKVIPIESECIKQIFIETKERDVGGWYKNSIGLGTALNAVIELTDGDYLLVENSEWCHLTFAKIDTP